MLNVVVFPILSIRFDAFHVFFNLLPLQKIYHNLSIIQRVGHPAIERLQTPGFQYSELLTPMSSTQTAFLFGETPGRFQCFVDHQWRSMACICSRPDLVGGIATPMKNMSSSVGMMTFPIYGKRKLMFQSPPTSNHIHSIAHNHQSCSYL